MDKMYHITFIATPLREKPEHSSEDVNRYEVRYMPARGIVQGTGGSTLEGLLVEAVCGLREHHTDKSRAIDVTLKGSFPRALCKSRGSQNRIFISTKITKCKN
ncbi:hypothetical protein HYW75_00465 [Candidatus Pacearchaeota archaeon]|nr:hypothetical protein [Candidatus Pacearchaeota archaeon]